MHLDNLNYNGLKAFIKKQTTGQAVAPIAIQSQPTDGRLHQGFEEDLFRLLVKELTKVDRFCSVKNTEIKFGLDSCRLHLERVLLRNNELRPIRTSTTLLHKLSNLEDKALSTGKTIAATSRFIGAQRTGFRKLIKSYQKWSGSTRLRTHFECCLERDTKFIGAKIDPMQEHLSHLTELLEDIRSPLDRTAPSQMLDPITPESKDLTAFVDSTFQSEPSDQSGGRATYWIHEQNLTEAQVALHRVFTRRSLVDQITNSTPKRSTASGFSSAKAHLNDFAGVVVFDELESLTEACDSNWPSTRAGLYLVESEKSISLAVEDKRIVMHRKDFRRLVLRPSSNSTTDSLSADLEYSRGWFKEHTVKRLADIVYKRSRFSGIRNTKSSCMWAMLDTNVIFDKNVFGDSLRLDGKSGNHRKFPHAILQVRWAGLEVPHIIKDLDEGHIAKRIPAFNIEAHAMATLYDNMPKPPWLETLGEDIRSMPLADTISAEPLSGPRSYKTQGSLTPITEGTSSAFSTVPDQTSNTSGGASPDLTASDLAEVQSPKRTRTRGRKRRRPETRNRSSPTTQYWNEFDDEERAVNEPFTVEVYPEDDIFDKTFSAIGKVYQTASDILLRRSRKRPEDQRMLLDSESGTVSIASTEDGSPSRSPRDYGTFKSGYWVFTSSNRDARSSLLRDWWLFHSTWVLFMFSALFLIMSLTLEATGRRRYTIETNTVAILGVAASGILAACAMATAFYREKLEWMGRITAVLGFVVVAVANGILVLIMVSR